MNKNNITGWFTTEDGVHVPIHGNESKVQVSEGFSTDGQVPLHQNASTQRFSDSLLFV